MSAQNKRLRQCNECPKIGGSGNECAKIGGSGSEYTKIGGSVGGETEKRKAKLHYFIIKFSFYSYCKVPVF